MRFHYYKLITLIAALGFLYGGFLSSPYIFDDSAFFTDGYSRNFVIQEHHFSWFQMRSLPYASFYWTKLVAGDNIEYLRLGNLIIHCAVVVAIYFAIYWLLQSTVKENPKKTNLSLIAWAAALIFAVHPLATYSVGYLAQRTVLMAALFSIITILFYIRTSNTGSKITLWLAVPTYYLAVYSKEHAIMLPFCLVALMVLLYEDWPRQLRREVAFYAVLACIAFTVFYSRKFLVGTLYEPNGPGYMEELGASGAHLRSVISQAALYFKYAMLWTLPNPKWMSIDMRENFATGVLSLQTLGALCYFVYGYIGIKLLLKRGVTGLFGFAMFFPWLMFFSEFSAVRVQEIFVIYRSYLWAFGWILILAVVFLKINSTKVVVLGASVSLLLMTISFERLQTLAHPLLLWDDAVKLIEKNPHIIGAERIYFNRGLERGRLNQFEGAKSDFEKTIELYADHIDARANLGAIYLKTEQWQNAVDQFNWVEQYGNTHNAYMNSKWVLGRGFAYEKLGNTDLAQKDFARSCSLTKLGCELVRK